MTPLTKGDALTACHLAYAQFLSEAGLKPEQMTDADKMIFHAGYLFGMQDTMARFERLVTES